MKIVTDTNVVVSGLLWLGTPGRLLEMAANGRVTLYTSPALVTELRSTLSYGRLAPRIQHSGLTLDELLGRYLNVAILAQPSAVPRIVVNDADDDQVLACALEAHADLIVSGDRKHLLPLAAIKAFRSSTQLRPCAASKRASSTLVIAVDQNPRTNDPAPSTRKCTNARPAAGGLSRCAPSAYPGSSRNSRAIMRRPIAPPF